MWKAYPKRQNMPLKTLLLSRRSMKRGYDSSLPSPQPLPYWSPSPVTRTSCFGSLTGSSRSSTWSTSVKMAVFAPIPSAIDRMATAVNTGALRRPRHAYRMSASTCVMTEGPPELPREPAITRGSRRIDVSRGRRVYTRAEIARDRHLRRSRGWGGWGGRPNQALGARDLIADRDVHVAVAQDAGVGADPPVVRRIVDVL